MKEILMRLRFLRAYRLDLKRRSGPLKSRRALAENFNARRFWFQRPVPIPDE